MKPLLLVLLGLACATAASAFNKPGHMLVASVAYADLANNPAVIAKVLEILKAHPFHARWKDDIQSERMDPERAKEYIFMMAARFADDARHLPEFNHDFWHYVNRPLTFENPSSFQFPALPRGELMKAIEDNLKQAKQGATAKEKALALSWVFHLVGDIHQPLHVVSLYSTKQPGWKNGDNGGTQFFVVPNKDSDPTTLHSLWDGAAIRSNDPRGIMGTARTLRAQRPRTSFAAELQLGWKPEAWAQESFDLAKTAAYQHAGAMIPGDDDEHVPVKVLPKAYLKNTGDVAERRIVLAGYRLADALRKL